LAAPYFKIQVVKHLLSYQLLEKSNFITNLLMLKIKKNIIPVETHSYFYHEISHQDTKAPSYTKGFIINKSLVSHAS
jgi:hypothetical protein